MVAQQRAEILEPVWTFLMENSWMSWMSVRTGLGIWNMVRSPRPLPTASMRSVVSTRARLVTAVSDQQSSLWRESSLKRLNSCQQLTLK